MALKNTFDFLVRRVGVLRLFQRNKRPLEVKVASALVYSSGLSYRGATGVMGLGGLLDYA